MSLRLRVPRLAAGLAIGTAVAIIVSGAAYAITSNVFRYSAPQAGWVSIDEAALNPGTATQTYTRNYTNSSLGAGQAGCFQTGVNLPNGARLTALKASYQSTGAASQTFLLFRRNINTGAGAFIVTGDSANTGSAPASANFPVPAPMAVVNNKAFAYGFAVCFPGTSALGFFSARISYTYTVAGS